MRGSAHNAVRVALSYPARAELVTALRDINALLASDPHAALTE
jgi:hypothetical protein